MMKLNQNGVTLIELIMIVAIVGLLGAMSISIYQDYAMRTRVSEGLALAAPAKIAVSETFASLDSVPNQAATGYKTPKSTGSVASISIANDGSGKITVLYTKAAGGKTLFLVPIFDQAKSIVWDCSGGTVAAKHRPTACRI